MSRTEVREALETGLPVVALETTLVAHGFPAPDGVAVGLASEAAVRAAGAVPATTGVLDGRIRVGLTEDELARFDPESRKLGPRDLAACAVAGDVGATTVGGLLTVARARRHPLRRDGRHRRRAPRLPDAARRLGRPARARHVARAVTCSGAKSLLDIPATMEYLETLGIPIARVPDRHASALLLAGGRPAGAAAGRGRRRPPRASRQRTGSSAGAVSSSRTRRPRASTSRS